MNLLQGEALRQSALAFIKHLEMLTREGDALIIEMRPYVRQLTAARQEKLAKERRKKVKEVCKNFGTLKHSFLQYRKRTLKGPAGDWLNTESNTLSEALIQDDSGLSANETLRIARALQMGATELNARIDIIRETVRKFR